MTHCSAPIGMVRAVAPIDHAHYRYVSIIRFANAYSVTLSNDPEGYAGGTADRFVASQFGSIGRAARLFNLYARIG